MQRNLSEVLFMIRNYIFASWATGLLNRPNDDKISSVQIQSRGLLQNIYWP